MNIKRFRLFFVAFIDSIFPNKNNGFKNKPPNIHKMPLLRIIEEAELSNVIDKRFYDFGIKNSRHIHTQPLTFFSLFVIDV